MYRKFLAVTFTSLLALSACGGDDGGSSASGSGGGVDGAKSCEDLAKAAVPLFEQVIQKMGNTNVADLAANQDAAAEIEKIGTEFTAQTDALQAKADTLGCSDADMQKALCPELQNMDLGDNELGKMMISELEKEC